MLSFGSLFSGIGGIDLGLEMAGMKCAWQIEYEETCQKILAQHWPVSPQYGDIKLVDEDKLEKVDLVCGGFPCQPFSVAGKQKGVNDERWMWPEFVRVLRGVRPRYVLIENVPGLLTSAKGATFQTILWDLANIGYDAEWEIISASAFGAPHKRKRLWIVAYANGTRQLQQDWGELKQWGWSEYRSPKTITNPDSAELRKQQGGFGGTKGQGEAQSGINGENGSTANSKCEGLEVFSRKPDHSIEKFKTTERSCREWDRWMAQSGFCRMDDGISGRLDGIAPTTKKKIHKRTQRIKALGNAVVPQIAQYIGLQILRFHRDNNPTQ